MNALLRVWIDLCLSRRGPESLPDSPLLLALFACLDLVLSLGAAVPRDHVVVAGLEALMSLALLSALIGGLLLAFGFPQRIRQTLMAAYAIDAGVTLIALPLVWLTAANLFEGGSLLIVGAVLWGTFVLGQALGSAIGRGRFFGILAALAINYVSVTLMSQLFG